MPLFLNEDQSMLQDSAREFIKAQGPVSHFREFRDKQCKDGFSHALWKQFAEMGFTGIFISEDDGGLGPRPCRSRRCAGRKSGVNLDPFRLS